MGLFKGIRRVIGTIDETRVFFIPSTNPTSQEVKIMDFFTFICLYVIDPWTTVPAQLYQVPVWCTVSESWNHSWVHQSHTDHYYSEVV